MANKNDSCIQILRTYGGTISDKANDILLSDKSLKKLEKPLRFIKNGYGDFTPALMNLANLTVGGKFGQTDEVALSYCLMNRCFTIWDDVIDSSQSKSFKPTVYGKFGRDTAIIIGGIASAKAFQILNNSTLTNNKKKRVNRIIWNLWTNMASVEVESLGLRRKGRQSSAKKLWKMKAESIDLGGCFRLGGIIGCGSKEQINCLDKFGINLGIILAIQKDFEVSINLTAELEDRIRSNHLPYCTLWGKEHSKLIDNKLNLCDEKSISSDFIQSIVDEMLQKGIYTHVCKLINKHKMAAESQLSQIPQNDATKKLNNIIDLRVESFFESMKEKGVYDN